MENVKRNAANTYGSIYDEVCVALCIEKEDAAVDESSKLNNQ